MSGVLNFGRSWLSRFVEVQGIDRAMAIAAQGFSALIPLIIVYSAVTPGRDGTSFADAIIDRFELDGSAADAAREAFTSSQTVEDSISLIGLLLLVVSALAFTRGLQRLYEGAYQLPALGMRGTPNGLLWLAVVVAYVTVRPVLAQIFDDGPGRAIVSIALAGALWTVTPYLLLGRRLHWHALLPGAALAAFGMAMLGVASLVWVPRTFASSADQFGAMGVAFALLSWLVAASVVLVVTATGGAVMLERMQGMRRRDSKPR